MAGDNTGKPLSAKWWAISVVTSVLSGGLAGLLSPYLAWKAEMGKEERERITAKINAVPTIVTHVDRVASETATVIVANEGPVAACSLVVSVQEILFAESNSTLKVIGAGSGRMSRRPWLFMTNHLAGGEAAEIPIGAIGIPGASFSVYHIEARYYPEFDLTTHLSSTTNFIVKGNTAIAAKHARHFMTNIAAVVRTVEEYASTNENHWRLPCCPPSPPSFNFASL